MTQTQTLHRLESLTRLYQDGYQSSAVDQTIEKLIHLEVARLETVVKQLQHRIVQLEERYEMTSKAFIKSFSSGQLDDNMDFVEWEAFWEMLQSEESKLDALREQIQ